MDTSLEREEETWCLEGMLARAKSEAPDSEEAVINLDTNIEIKKETGCFQSTLVAQVKSEDLELQVDTLTDQESQFKESERLCTEADPYVSDTLHVNTCFTRSSDLEEFAKGFANSNEGNTQHKGNIFEHCFATGEHLKAHNFLYEAERPCKKSVNKGQYVKTRYLIPKDYTPYKCNICGKGFTTKLNMAKHYSNHQARKLHKCNICGKSLSRADHLKRHYLIHQDKMQHKCNVCERRFTRADHLKRHSLTHESKISCKCNICGRSFIRTDNFKKHYLIHKDIIAHKCNICGNVFTTELSLKKHNLLHEHEIPEVMSLKIIHPPSENVLKLDDYNPLLNLNKMSYNILSSQQVIVWSFENP